MLLLLVLLLLVPLLIVPLLLVLTLSLSRLCQVPTCLPCSPGRHTTHDGAKACTACPIGHYR